MNAISLREKQVYLQMFCGLEVYHTLNMPSIISLWYHLDSRGLVTIDVVVCGRAGHQHPHAVGEVVQFRVEKEVIDQRSCHTSTHRAYPIDLKTEEKSFQTEWKQHILKYLKVFVFVGGIGTSWFCWVRCVPGSTICNNILIPKWSLDHFPTPKPNLNHE